MKFNPPIHVKNRHIQSIIGTLSSHDFPEIPWEYVEPTSSDGSLMRGKLSRKDTSKKLAIVYHGLGGHPDSYYVLGTAASLYQSGFNVVRMALRGAERGPTITPSIYHSGQTEDIGSVTEYFYKKGFEEIFLVGFSLSANMILKWLGEKPRSIKKAFVVSPPVRLKHSAELLDHWKNKPYQIYFLKKLYSLISEKADLYPETFARYLDRAFYKTVRGFDENVTCKHFGFKGADDYYEKSSSYPLLPLITTPTKIIHSLDDPFLDSSDLETITKKAHPFLDISLTQKGGHMGFYEGKKNGYRIWSWVKDYFSIEG